MSDDKLKLNQIAEEFEAAWARLETPDLTEFLERVDTGQRIALAELLLPTDLEYRIRNGVKPRPDDYRSLGSEIVELVAKLLADEHATQDHSQSSFAKSRTIGPYKLLQEIAEGGMGTVWMAEQEHPIRRRVALKLIKTGLDTKQVIARFEAERQALAMMDHQNIAKVLDAGTTDDGRPYFVMELVQGIPLTTYCDQNKLSLNERLELLIPVCKAVQHAHQKGIIHRDLKPSNVLVTLYDGKPVPKVIDFGLAKALQHQTKLTDKTMFTEFGQVVGTLQYMSPEQAEMNALDIDTRTDVYSLGVMLYELLTGSTPIEKETLQKEAVLKVLESIREKEPPRPSVRLSSSSNEVISGISQQRRIDPQHLKNVLRGELDWIVMKALEKDRTRRYATANGLADELHRYLTGDMVEARPPSTLYRMRKLVNRHKGLVASMISIVAILLAGIAGTSWFAMAADTARDTSKKSELAAIDDKEKARIAKEFAEENKKLADKNAAIADDQKNIAIREKTSADLQRIAAQKSEEKSAELLYSSKIKLADAFWEAGATDKAWETLNLCSWELRGWEHDYLFTKFTHNQVTLRGHTRAVDHVSFSTNGELVLSGSEDEGAVRVWSTTTGRELECFKLAANDQLYPLDMFLSHERPLFAAQEMIELAGVESLSIVPSSTAKIWDLRSGDAIATIKFGEWEPDNYLVLNAFKFSPDGEVCAGVFRDGTIRIWKTNNGVELQTLKSESSEHQRADPAWSADGKRLAVQTEIALHVWDITTSEKVLTKSEHFFERFEFTSDGKQIIGIERGVITILDVETGATIRTFGEQQEEHSLAVAVSDDGKRVISYDYYSAGGFGGGGLFSVPSDGTFESTGVSGNVSKNSGPFSTEIQLWDAMNGEKLREFQGHTDNVSALAFSPGGDSIASGSYDNSVRLWNLTANENPATIKDVENVGAGFAISHDGQTIVSCGNSSIGLFDIDTSETIRSIGTALLFKGRPVNSGFVFTNDGDYVRWLDGDLQLKNIVGKPRFHLPWGVGLILAVNTNESDFIDWVALKKTHQGHGVVRLGEVWNPDSENDAYRPILLKGNINDVTCAAFSISGQQVACGNTNNTVTLWNSGTGDLISTLGGHTEGVTCVAYSPDETTVASGSADTSVNVWNAKNGELCFSLKGHARTVSCVAFSPNAEKIASGDGDGFIKFWNAKSGINELNIPGLKDAIKCLAFSPDSDRIVGVIENGVLKVWDVKSGNELLTLKGHANHELSCVAFSPDGKWILGGSSDGTIVYDAVSGQETRTDQRDGISMREIEFFPDDNKIAIGSYDSVAIVDLSGHQKPIVFKPNDEFFGKSALSHDGTIVVTFGDTYGGQSHVTVWDAPTGHQSKVLNINTNVIAYSPDDCHLAVEGSGARIISIASGKQVVELQDPDLIERFTSSITVFSYSPDGHRLAGGTTEGEIYVWNAANGKLLLTLKGHADSISSITFSPDGRRGASSSDDGNIRIWNAQTGDELLELVGHVGPIPCIEFSTNAQRLVSCSDDGTIKVWNASRHQVLDLELANEMSASAWKSILVPGPNGDYLRAFRDAEAVFNLFPSGTNLSILGVAQFRVGQFDAAIENLEKSMPMVQAEYKLPSPHPVNLAFLAMSHRHLANTDEANKYRKEFEEAMMQKRFKPSTDVMDGETSWCDEKQCRQIAREVEELFSIVEPMSNQE